MRRWKSVAGKVKAGVRTGTIGDWGRGVGVALWMPRWLRLRCGAMGGVVLKVKLCDSAETISCGRWEGVSHTRPFLTGLGFETLGERCEQSGRWR